MAVLGQGVVLMVAGMGIVYLFLWVLIVISEKASQFVSRFDSIVPDEAPKKAKRAAGGPKPAAPMTAGGSADGAAPGGGEKVVAPVPGTVLRITAANGSRVAKGDELLVMDVMKMETPFSAPCDGTVTMRVAATDKVATGDTLALVG